MKAKTMMWSLVALIMPAPMVAQPHKFRQEAFTTDTPMVHDPVMAQEGDTYYIFATGLGIQQMTSKDRKTWTVSPEPVMSVIPKWTMDSVPGFCHQVSWQVVARL